MRNTIKTLFIIFVFFGFFSAFGDIAQTDDRIKFQELLENLSKASQLNPINCSESRDGSASLDVLYSFTLEAEPNYKDAYFLRFQAENSSADTWATLIAYEGYNGHIMGELSRVQQSSDVVKYRHIFHGYYKDILSLTLSHGELIELSFQKIGPTGVFYDLSCSV